MHGKSHFCYDRHGQWDHASASGALQRLRRGLSLRDGFRGCEEAPSWQPDASETLLHTFHLSTAWPGHEGMEIKRRGSEVVWGSHSYSRGHLIGTWITSYPFSPASPESLNAFPEPLSGWESYSTASLNPSNTHLCSHSNCTLSGLLIALCWGVGPEVKLLSLWQTFQLHTSNFHEDKEEACIGSNHFNCFTPFQGFPGNPDTHWSINGWTG